MAREEKIYEIKMFTKIQKHLAWMATNQPGVLGDRVNEMMQFVADKSEDAIAELQDDEAEADEAA